MNPQNKRLYKGYLDACIPAINLLKRELKGPPRRTISEIVVFHRDGSYSTTYVMRRPIHQMIRRQTKNIEALPEYNSLAAILNHDKRIAYLRTVDENQAQHHIFFAFFGFLARLAPQRGPFNFNQADFDAIYQRYEDYIYADTFVNQGFCLLRNFESDQKKIELDFGLFIKKISNEQRRIVYGMRSLPDYELLDLKWIIQKTEQVKREKRFSWDSLYDEFSRVLAGLRLYKAGDIGYTHIYSKTLSSWDTTTRANLLRPNLRGERYTLTNKDMRGFRAWWKCLKKYWSDRAFRNREDIKISLSRLNQAYERKSYEDELIDYMVGFESILLEGGGELRYKLSQRTALLLGTVEPNNKKRGEYQLRAKAALYKAYDLRSQVVHGSKVLPTSVRINADDIPISQFIKQTSDYLRASIREYYAIAKDKNKVEILEKLDKKALGIST